MVDKSTTMPDAVPTPAGQRRRSSQLFQGLTAQKRKEDPVSVARRQSMNEQRPQVGFFGTMWQNFVRGPESRPEAGSPPK
ncbi:hypothetical protein QBC46DRAFT_344949 [Diplogelasinospora grovesii]|uniref:Conidiation-specific protein 8 n=1 Tax=Diplogelasinospora grovesii TaxID=303347 RepID=A0AAN6N3C0_9PEZI|nr:hypothetical protein QBC46DRAFT_344949 [Diplogelasinospora grovesii]